MKNEQKRKKKKLTGLFEFFFLPVVVFAYLCVSIYDDARVIFWVKKVWESFGILIFQYDFVFLRLDFLFRSILD
jgi:hypothetical protein